MKETNDPIAVILGDIDMLRPLALEGIPCAVCAVRGALPRYSRYATEVIKWFDPWEHPDKLVDTLVDFGSRQSTKPILFYESDADLLMISRNRERLGEVFRFVVPEPELTENLVDKLKFQALAQRLDLPVPNARFTPASANADFDVADLRFPLIVKPLMRKKSEWAPVAGLSKAVAIENEADLRKFKQSLDARGIDFLMQEMIPGAESAIESYHVYVDEEGQMVGEFTGKKIRTYPREFGQSCALTISDADDVAELGRELVGKLNFRGLAKFDFKRTPDGRLFLLEVNPRFSLWHHLGAVAGVNLPLLVYCDLAGRQRPVFGKAKAGTNWCRLWQDVFSARADGVSLGRWIPWALRCKAKPGFSLDDPMPLIGAAFWRMIYKVSPARGKRPAVRDRATQLSEKKV